MARIEAESRSGLQYKVLDDLRADLDPDSLKRPSYAVSKKYQEQVLEARLLRDAKKRGIDPIILKRTARQLDIQEKCTKSIFSKPRSKVFDLEK